MVVFLDEVLPEKTSRSKISTQDHVLHDHYLFSKVQSGSFLGDCSSDGGLASNRTIFPLFEHSSKLKLRVPLLQKL